MEEKILKKIQTRKELVALLGIDWAKFKLLFYILAKSELYRTFEIKKRNGGTRRIDAPKKHVKAVQKQLAGLLAEIYNPRDCVNAYTKCRSIISNAEPHIRKRWLLKFDLADFFPSITFPRIRGLLMAPPYSLTTEVATTIAHVTTLDGRLPQGAPTSPILSNMICAKMDSEFIRLLSQYHCYYTRYADDIAITANKSVFPSELAEFQPDFESESAIVVLGSGVANTVNLNGFQINDEKTRLIYRSQRMMVTGLVVNKKVNLPRKYIRGLRGALHAIQKYGWEAACQKFWEFDKKNRPLGSADVSRYKLVIRGRVQYVGQIRGWSDELYIKFATKLVSLDRDFFPHKEAVQANAKKVMVFAEGPTDYMHLRAALSSFKKEGKFIDLDIEFHDPDYAEGDKKLLAKCKEYAQIEQSNPCIFIFDSDVEGTLKAATVSTARFKDWSNNVYSFAIPKPEFRDDNKLCIEMLYQDDILKKQDSSCRRIFLRPEFEAGLGLHNTDNNLICLNPQSTSLIVDRVTDVKKRSNVALSKKLFAENIEKNPESVNFSGFSGIFEVIQEILQKRASAGI